MCGVGTDLTRKEWKSNLRLEACHVESPCEVETLGGVPRAPPSPCERSALTFACAVAAWGGGYCSYTSPRTASWTLRMRKIARTASALLMLTRAAPISPFTRRTQLRSKHSISSPTM